jgi:hypothetical protein
MSAFSFIEVHKSTIKSGDIILHNDKLMTVCDKDMKSNSFFGLTIFGDSYNMGNKLVLKGVYNGAK